MTAELRIYESNDLKPANTRARATVIFRGGLLDGITVSDIRICDPASQGESLQVRSASLVGLQEHTPLGQCILKAHREGYMRIDLDGEDGWPKTTIVITMSASGHYAL